MAQKSFLVSGRRYKEIAEDIAESNHQLYIQIIQLKLKIVRTRRNTLRIADGMRHAVPFPNQDGQSPDDID